MKKRNIMIITGILFTIFLVAGATFAFFTAYKDSGNKINTNTSNFGVVFEPGNPIDGNMELSSSKDDSGVLKTEVNIKMKSGSPLANATIFFTIEEMTANLSIDGFIWEVVGTRNNVETYSNKGTFKGYNSTTNRTINVVENYPLTEENTTFTIYFWLNGDLIQDTSILNSTFSGYIGAKTDNFTAELK